jgi:hypothetical protein
MFREDKMAEAKTTEQRALAHISNKVDEVYVKIEQLEELLKKRLAAPPPAARKDASAAAATSSGF